MAPCFTREERLVNEIKTLKTGFRILRTELDTHFKTKVSHGPKRPIVIDGRRYVLQTIDKKTRRMARINKNSDVLLFSHPSLSELKTQSGFNEQMAIPVAGEDSYAALVDIEYLKGHKGPGMGANVNPVFSNEDALKSYFST